VVFITFERPRPPLEIPSYGPVNVRRKEFRVCVTNLIDFLIPIFATQCFDQRPKLKNLSRNLNLICGLNFVVST